MNLTHKGFTLAELLAVVIIVSLMATFGVGYYRRSVEQAKFSEVVVTASKEAEQATQNYFDLALQNRLYEWGGASYAEKCGTSNNYCVRVTMGVEVTHKNLIACVGTDGANGTGQAFCESMGYLHCQNVTSSDIGSGMICTRGDVTWP